jgi:hypothetical protein
VKKSVSHAGILVGIDKIAEVRFLRQYFPRVRTLFDGGISAAVNKAVNRQPVMIGMRAEIERKCVIAFREIGTPTFAGVKNSRAAKSSKVPPKAGVDYEIGVVAQFDLVLFTQQSTEIVVVRIETGPEVAESKPDPWLHKTPMALKTCAALNTICLGVAK